jgi:hypothetical protein
LLPQTPKFARTSLQPWGALLIFFLTFDDWGNLSPISIAVFAANQVNQGHG